MDRLGQFLARTAGPLFPYPGRPDGSQTERVSWAIAEQVVEKCDYT